MKPRAKNKYERSRYLLWVANRPALMIWIDEMAAMTDAQWDKLTAATTRYHAKYDFGPGAVFMNPADSTWIKIGLFENVTV